MLRKRVTLTEDAVAAIAVGIPVADAVAEHPASEPETPTEPVVAAETPAGDPPTDDPPVQDPPAAAIADTSDDEPVADPNLASASSEDSTLTTLLNKVGTLQTELAEKNVALSAATVALDSATALQASFMDVASTFIGRMNIPLGGSAPELSHLNAEQLLTQYQVTNAEFCKRFHVGGKADVKVEDKRNSENVVPLPAVTRATAFKKGG